MISSLLLAATLLQGNPEAGLLAGFPGSPSAEQNTALDSAALEMERGRFWRAARRLRRAFPDGPGEDPDLRLLFARAEAGWGNWQSVRLLLEGPLDSGSLEGSEAWYFLARALANEGEWEAAERAYGKVLEADTGQVFPLREAARARRVGVQVELGQYAVALDEVEELRQVDPPVAGWAALNLAHRAAIDGALEETRMALSKVSRAEVRRLGWSLLPSALLASGDSTGAEAAFWSSLPSLYEPSDKAVAWDRVATLRLARGDSAGARAAFHQVLSLPHDGAESLTASETLLDLGFDSVEVALKGARTLEDAGRYQDALEAYGIYEALLGDSLPPSVLLSRARSLMGLGRWPRVLSDAEALIGSEDSALAAGALSLRIQALRRLGRGAEAREAENELVARFPDRAEAVQIVYSRAEGYRNRGALEEALAAYGETAAMSPTLNLAGQARMWMGQILMGAGREDAALEVYSGYLNDFPDGRRWDEAAFWAGRLLLSAGKEDEALGLLNQLRQDHPLSYYSVRAGELIGEPYDPPVRESMDSLPLSPFLQQGLMTLDRLWASGLVEGATWEVNALAARLRAAPDSVRRRGELLRLATELNSRGYTREGINLGWELRREGAAWNRELLAVVYPFPYREILLAEGRERRVDPYLMAGLIRQESAFWREARSRADARGLMQVLPATGRELARAAGLDGFRVDDHLYQPEINIHLGVSFFVDMRRRFGEDLPIILSAYNAGPSRARRWREYPEARDMILFVERIPFTETKGYVKNVLANRAIYTWLYGPPGEGGR